MRKSAKWSGDSAETEKLSLERKSSKGSMTSTFQLTDSTTKATKASRKSTTTRPAFMDSGTHWKPFPSGWQPYGFTSCTNIGLDPRAFGRWSPHRHEHAVNVSRWMWEPIRDTLLNWEEVINQSLAACAGKSFLLFGDSQLGVVFYALACLIHSADGGRHKIVVKKNDAPGRRSFTVGKVEFINRKLYHENPVRKLQTEIKKANYRAVHLLYNGAGNHFNPHNKRKPFKSELQARESFARAVREVFQTTCNMPKVASGFYLGAATTSFFSGGEFFSPGSGCDAKGPTSRPDITGSILNMMISQNQTVDGMLHKSCAKWGSLDVYDMTYQRPDAACGSKDVVVDGVPTVKNDCLHKCTPGLPDMW
eukprot:CAMPEP_0118944826 /NCGR_PEP_ID=MMETSP1169-20130426/41090_1 /TAXON_ID=36882 /ORGANISM="Pyramimonas obovata, Strain CCMP722" /LENGTH=363 /DNA_ID=CAMNT_0006890395 /DNA_START=414 /DNA_END=1502 /DNA_ORIENTATION=+